MKNQILLITAFFIIIATIGGGVYFLNQKQETPKINENQSQISKEEQEFNDSGRAKAIEDETDLWKVYEDKSGFTIKYPSNVTLNSDSKIKNGLDLNITSIKINELNGTLGYDKETATKNKQALENGQTIENVDLPFEDSKNIINISRTNILDFIVFSRFEICSVVFERKAYFFKDDYQIVVTLSMPKEKVIKDYPEYFKIDKANCGDEEIWNYDKRKEFYEKAKKGELGIASEWLTTFDSIIKTLDISPRNKETGTKYLLIGKWQSDEDSKFVTEFTSSEQVDYYDGKEIASNKFTLNGDIISVDSFDEKLEYKILEVTNEKLSLSYLGRGNTLNFKRVK
ncbi:MAG: hypothetical protein WCX74_02705 [Candidatus Paceibacterota bacterium]